MHSVVSYDHRQCITNQAKLSRWDFRMDKEVYSRQEVKEVLGCSIAVVDSLIRSGRLKAIRLSPRRIVISRQALEAFLQDALNA